MAKDRRDESKIVKPVHRHTEEHSKPEEGPGAPYISIEGEEEGETGEGLQVGEDRIRLSITTRRVRIDPDKKRKSYIRRLERIMRQCDGIINDPTGFEELQLRAIGLQIQTIKVCYGLILDIEVETLEKEVTDLKAEEARIRGEAGKKSLGYKVEDSTN
jgi:hypothetical protein